MEVIPTSPVALDTVQDKMLDDRGVRPGSKMFWQLAVNIGMVPEVEGVGLFPGRSGIGDGQQVSELGHAKITLHELDA